MITQSLAESEAVQGARGFLVFSLKLQVCCKSLTIRPVSDWGRENLCVRRRRGTQNSAQRAGIPINYYCRQAGPEATLTFQPNVNTEYSRDRGGEDR